jgi:serine/threonine-protein kinase RsbT
LAIISDGDIVAAREVGRALAIEAGFSGSDPTLVATAISEIARNILQSGLKGEIRLSLARRGTRRGIVIMAKDDGPGLSDAECIMRDGFPDENSQGLGLPGARRLMDEFDIVSAPGTGTIVTMTKWV